jgi:molecular chaperone GrpE
LDVQTDRVSDQVGAVTEGTDADDSAEQVADRLRAEIVDLDDRWRRAVADLDNLRKRFAREREVLGAEERARVAAQWLPVLDHLELALEHAQADPASIVEGVRGVRDEAIAVLARLGFPRDGTIGDQFDPERHEAVSTVVDPTVEPGTVVHVVRPGYGGGERALRPAAVVVATKAD